MGPITGGVEPGVPAGARIGWPSGPICGGVVAAVVGNPLRPIGCSRFGGSPEIARAVSPGVGRVVTPDGVRNCVPEVLGPPPP